jgi:hypothetical protein
VNKIRREELCEEGGQDVGEEDGGFGDIGTHEIESGRENNHVGDIIDET